jgi:hypothetical protein
MIKNSDQPAQPIVYTEKVYDSFGDCVEQVTVKEGLTKREYFAGLAMQGLLTSQPPYKDGRYYGVGVEETKKNIRNFVEHSLLIADELLKQLEK